MNVSASKLRNQSNQKKTLFLSNNTTALPSLFTAIVKLIEETTILAEIDQLMHYLLSAMHKKKVNNKISNRSYEHTL